MEQAEKEGFYSDLDETKLKRQTRRSCGCVPLAIFFVALLVCLEVGLYLIAHDLKSNSQNPNSSIPQGQLSIKPSSTDLGSNQFSLTISQGILCQTLAENVKINDLKCAISQDGIELGGKISAFLPSNSKVVLMPEVADGRINFKVKKVSVGFISVPSVFANHLTKTLNSSLYSAFSDLEKAQVDKVELRESVMIITAKKI